MILCLLVVGCDGPTNPHQNPDGGNPFLDGGDGGGVDAPPDAPGGTANLVVVEADLDFGIADIGETLTRWIHITNNGTAVVGVGATANGGRDFTTDSGVAIPPAATAMLQVQFLPYATGVHTSSYTLVSGAWTATIPVRGDTYTKLTLSRWGQGDIIAPAQSITCSDAECRTRFVGDVVLEAVPDLGNTFVAWSDPSCGTQSTCTLHQDAAGRAVRAYFAPSSGDELSLTIGGDAAGVVEIKDGNDSEVAACRSSCTVPLPVSTPVHLKAQGLSNVATITGACSGLATCSFTPGGSAAATVTFERDTHEGWTRTLEAPTATAVAYDSTGNLLVVTSAFDVHDAAVIKLDPQGHTLWAHPSLLGAEITIGPMDTVNVRSSENHQMWVLDRDGYMNTFGYNFADVEGSAFAESPYYFQHRMVTSEVLFALGPKNGTTVHVYGGPYNWTNSLAAQSLEQLAVTATQILVAVGNSHGGADLATLAFDGTQQATVPDVAPHQAMTFQVMSNGDLVTSSGTGTQVSLRRISNGVTTVSRDVAFAADFPDAVAPHSTATEVDGDRVFWLYGARDPREAPVGFNAEVVNPDGSVSWSIARPIDPRTQCGVEVYDLARHGAGVAVVGGYRSISPAAGGGALSVLFAEGYVQTWIP
ncbi:MAG: hypothetical protein ABI678_10735 [Kofleriaceae bacterium]